MLRDRAHCVQDERITRPDSSLSLRMTQEKHSYVTGVVILRRFLADRVPRREGYLCFSEIAEVILPSLSKRPACPSAHEIFPPRRPMSLMSVFSAVPSAKTKSRRRPRRSRNSPPRCTLSSSRGSLFAAEDDTLRSRSPTISPPLRPRGKEGPEKYSTRKPESWRNRPGWDGVRVVRVVRPAFQGPATVRGAAGSRALRETTWMGV